MKAITQLHQKLINSVGPLNGKSVLDYGCGRGDMIELLLHISNGPQMIFAVDSNEEFIRGIETRFGNAIGTKKLFTQTCSNPYDLVKHRFDIIFCHNVLECVADKQKFVKDIFHLLKPGGILLLSHHDFDSVIYNSEFKELTRNLVHCFADTKQDWQANHDGQMGRKIPGIFARANVKNATFEIWRMVENSYDSGDYGFLMSKMILDVCKNQFSKHELDLWRQDLESKAKNKDYYFAIDVVVAKAVENNE